MRLIQLMLLCSCLSFAMQESDYKSNVLMLKDGRMIAIRGDYEIIGDEIQFMYADGNLTTLPLAKVDLEATRIKQAALEKKLKENAAKAKALQGEETVYDQIRAYQAERDEAGEDQSTSADTQKTNQSRVFEKKEKARNTGLDFETNPFAGMSQEEAQRKAEEIIDHFEDISSGYKWLLIGLGAMAAITGLISLFLRIFLMWTARHNSNLWALALAMSTLAPIIHGLVTSFIPDGSMFKSLLAIGLTVLQLLEPIIYTLYIVIYCTGKRLLYLALYFAPFIFIIGMVVALIFIGFPMMGF